MDIRGNNDRKRLEALASAKARDGFEAVLPLMSTEGAANSGHMSPPLPRKPDDLLPESRRHLISEFTRVKMASVCESSPYCPSRSSSAGTCTWSAL
jgi:hypothetical protein